MPSGRYVLLGLAPARAEWFRAVAQWANTGMVPAEFIKCLSAEEVRARLGGGRAFSALLVDAAVPSLDVDLIEAAREAGCCVIVVGGTRAGRNWATLGAASLLPLHFDRKDLVDVLSEHASLVGRADRIDDVPIVADADGWRAPLLCVTGPGGTGASTAAIALAQALATDVRASGSVLLADLRLHAEQAMIHDALDVVPGIQELVEAFRSGRPTGDDLRALTFAVPARGYQLLLGLRRARAWSTIRPRAFEAALDGLRRAHRAVVCDVDPDIEGEDEGGSLDVEERHVMARVTFAQADAVFVIGSPGMKGFHSLVRVIGDLVSYGVPGVRIVPVINRAPRNARARAEITRAVAQLMPSWAGAGMSGPLFIPDRRVDEACRDGVPLPDSLVTPLVGAYQAVVERAEAAERRPLEPQLVRPGSLGTWTPEFAE
jgi:MinD-like ATPase involved in chromosome partitioning or flagellar assembly